MKKVLSIVLVFALFLCVFTITPISSAALTSGNYNYKVLDDGTASITRYTGSASKLTIPSSLNGYVVTSIYDDAFMGCSSLSSIVIPDTVTNIEQYAFYSCTNLNSVTIPNSVTYIGLNAFDETAWFDNQQDGLVYAGKVAYKMKGECPSSVTIKNGTVGIADDAFWDCENLTSVTIPNSVKIIGWSSFEYTGLISVTLPDSISYIGPFAFCACSSLTNVSIPKSVLNIDRKAFSNCSSLTNITVDRNNNKYCSIDGSLYDKSATTLIQYAIGKSVKSFTIPDSVTTIGDSAFSECSNLTSVTIPNSVKSIDDYAFECCDQLTSVVIPDSVTYLGSWAFFACENLTTVNIGNSVTSIDMWTFRDCSKLKTVTIGNAVKNISEYAFIDCVSLSSVIIPKSVQTIADSAFYGIDSLTDIFYTGSEDDWKKISIDDYNDSLNLATIHYGDDYFVTNRDTNQFIHKGLVQKFYDRSVLQKLINNTFDPIDIYNVYKSFSSEKKGVCHGIAMTMCLGNQGNIDFNYITEGAVDYWSLGDPVANPRFSDMINYYQFTQQLTFYKSTKSVQNKGFANSLSDSKLKSFLQSFVAEAKKSQEERKPFVFSFFEGEDVGHSVVVCGYNYNSSTNCHEIKTYDENSYTSGYPLQYDYFEVSADYSSFSYQDANARYQNSNLQSKWTSLSYYSINDIYNKIHNKNLKATPAATGTDNTVTFIIPYGVPFKLSASNGQFISYDGNDYDGNLEVYDNYLIGIENNPEWVVKVDKMESYIFTDYSKEFYCSYQYQNTGFQLISDSSERITLNDYSIEIEGNNYSLGYYTANDMIDSVYYVSTDVSGSSTINLGETNQKFHTKGCFSNTEITCFSNGEMQSKEELLDSNIIALNTNGRLLGDVDDDGEIMITDATYIQRKIAQIEIPFDFSATIADTDGDGQVTLIDATYIQRWLANLNSNDNIGKPIT